MPRVSVTEAAKKMAKQFVRDEGLPTANSLVEGIAFLMASFTCRFPNLDLGVELGKFYKERRTHGGFRV